MGDGCIDYGFQLGVIVGMGIGAVIAALGVFIAVWAIQGDSQ
jgi:hypothetical protein